MKACSKKLRGFTVISHQPYGGINVVLTTNAGIASPE
jgi:hypothetical protein